MRGPSGAGGGDDVGEDAKNPIIIKLLPSKHVTKRHCIPASKGRNKDPPKGLLMLNQMPRTTMNDFRGTCNLNERQVERDVVLSIVLMYLVIYDTNNGSGLQLLVSRSLVSLASMKSRDLLS